MKKGVVTVEVNVQQAKRLLMDLDDLQNKTETIQLLVNTLWSELLPEPTDEGQSSPGGVFVGGKRVDYVSYADMILNAEMERARKCSL